MEELLNASVTNREEVCDGLWIFQVSPDEGEVPEFESGQYAELGMPAGLIDPSLPEDKAAKIVRRAYSIGSAPKERDHLEFFVVKVDDGALTPKLYELKPGDRLWLGPKIKGKFTLEPIPEGSNIICVATGTGLAPFISMLRQHLGEGRWKRFVVIHGARLQQDLAYAKELKELSEQHEDVFYVPAVTREPEDSDWKGLRGRVGTILEPNAFKEILGFDLSAEDCHVLLCGNPDMIDSIQSDLEGRGFQKHSKKNPGNIHFERYW